MLKKQMYNSQNGQKIPKSVILIMKFQQNPHTYTVKDTHNYCSTCSSIYWCITTMCGLGSSVGIATGYGLESPGIKSQWDGPGIESQWGRDFLRLSRPALGPTQPPVQGAPGLSREQRVAWGVTLTPHPLLVPCSRKSRAILLLPLWAVRPVQSLSACTRVHFIFLLQCVQNLKFVQATTSPNEGGLSCCRYYVRPTWMAKQFLHSSHMIITSWCRE